MNDTWKQDPRLRSMNPEKIQFLADFAQELNQTPKDQTLAKFIALSSQAQSRGITFSDQETKLLTDILLHHLTPADKSRFDMLYTLSQKLASRRG
ncbi:MAG: hypothetical protein HFG70_04025 [Hungatella sp.]|nr:hypothetical protein [Hungatella sp.]